MLIRRKQSSRYPIALGVALLDLILIFITLIQHIPALVTAMGIFPSQTLEKSGLWAIIAEVLFIWAMLVMLYGMLSLWLPELRFTLWAGVGLAVLAGGFYLLAGVLDYHQQGLGAPLRQGLFMFLLSLTLPLLAIRLVKLIEHKESSITRNPYRRSSPS